MTKPERDAGLRWNPSTYLRFEEERLRPAVDLLSRVPIEAPSSIIDLGCGTGNVTRLLRQRWPEAEITGIDASPEMLARAAEAELSGVLWRQADIAQWAQESEPRVDLIFSNAALHWLPEHSALLPQLALRLRPGGALAVQMPFNWKSPSHRIVREVAADGYASPELRAKLGAPPVHAAEEYYAWLEPFCDSLDLWYTEYIHSLAGEEPVLQWVSGTTLRGILPHIDESDRQTFLEELGMRLANAYPRHPNGRTLYPFRRLFLVARRATGAHD